ncbi:MAG: exodeoxyribonuclease VII large subunit [Planctomycetota bacterium]
MTGIASATPLFDNTARPVLTVTEITRLIKRDLEIRYPEVTVGGEVSDLSRPRSGHVYFTLTDEHARLNAVLWRWIAARLPFSLEDGLAVVAGGGITVYEAGGRYQLIVRDIAPKGMGGQQLALLQLRRKLAAEGLFDPARKRPLPFLPRTVGIVTSPTGAAVRDMIAVLRKRFPAVNILLRPVRVQGVGAAVEIAGGIRDINRHGRAEVLIVGRGGGSAEDLAAFNEECVARAIVASRIPVISAVGHEIDVTIADLVADRRAVTPTEAGEMAVPEIRDLEEDVRDSGVSLVRALRRTVAEAWTRLAGMEKSHGLRMLPDRLREAAQRLDGISGRLERCVAETLTAGRADLAGLSRRLAAGSLRANLVRRREVLSGAAARFLRVGTAGLAAHEARLAGAAGRLEALGPLQVLRRGYSITRRQRDGRIVRRAMDVAAGDAIETRYAAGRSVARVESVAQE